jgi:proto-oncogene tyrosine-protein kinase Ret
MWEVLMMGEEPYPGMSPQNAALAVLAGKRLAVPDHAPEWIASMLKSCWATSPDDRPNFGQLCLLCKKQLLRIERESGGRTLRTAAGS